MYGSLTPASGESVHIVEPGERRVSSQHRAWSSHTLAVAVAGATLWRSRSLDRDPTLQQGHLGCLARVDREREPQRRIERDAKLVVAEVPNLIRFLALGLRYETRAVQEET
jgi:hypothetical protein